MLPAGDYARSGYYLPENHPPDIFEDNIFPGIWTKVFERPSNRYLEGDFYIVYVRDRVLVLFQKILSLFTIILPVLYNCVMAECFFSDMLNKTGDEQGYDFRC